MSHNEAQKLFWKKMRRALYNKQQASNVSNSDQTLNAAVSMNQSLVMDSIT